MYNDAYFDRHEWHWVAKSSSEILCLAAKFGFPRNRGYVLDIGCGDGFYMRQFQTASRPIFGCDISLVGLRRAKSAGSVFCPDAVALPVRNGVIKHIFCSEVLEHLSDPLSALREMHRISSEGGILFLTTTYHFIGIRLLVGMVKRI